MSLMHFVFDEVSIAKLTRWVITQSLSGFIKSSKSHSFQISLTRGTKLPSEMSSKEIREELELLGLSDKAHGLCTKADLVRLLNNAIGESAVNEREYERIAGEIAVSAPKFRLATRDAEIALLPSNGETIRLIFPSFTHNATTRALLKGIDGGIQETCFIILGDINPDIPGDINVILKKLRSDITFLDVDTIQYSPSHKRALTLPLLEPPIKDTVEHYHPMPLKRFSEQPSGILLIDIVRDKVLLACSEELDSRSRLSFEVFKEFSTEACSSGLETLEDTARRAVLVQTNRCLECALNESDWHTEHITLHDENGDPEYTVFIVILKSDLADVCFKFNSAARMRLKEGKKLTVTELKYFPLQTLLKSVEDSNEFRYTGRGKVLHKHVALCDQNIAHSIGTRTCRVLCEARGVIESLTRKKKCDNIGEQCQQPDLGQDIPIGRQLSHGSQAVADRLLDNPHLSSNRRRCVFEALRAISSAYSEGRIDILGKQKLKSNIARMENYDSQHMTKMTLSEQRMLLLEFSSRSYG
jgi:hypothetical protein